MGICLRGIYLSAVLVVLFSVNIAVFGYQCAFITKDQWGNDHSCSNVAQEPYYNEKKGCNDYYCRPHIIGIKAAAENKKEGKKLVRTSSTIGSNPITLRRGSIDLGDSRGITKLNHIVMDGQPLHASIESVFQPVLSYGVYVVPKDANEVGQPLDEAPPIIDAQSANQDRREIVNIEQPP